MLNPKIALLLTLYGFRAAFVAASPTTVTVTTTVTECAASCFTTMNICTNTNENDIYTSASPASTTSQDLPPAYTREKPSETPNNPPKYSLPVSLPAVSAPDLPSTSRGACVPANDDMGPPMYDTQTTNAESCVRPTSSSSAAESSNYGIPTVILSTTGQFVYPNPSVSYVSSIDAIETTAYETPVPTTFVTNSREYSSVDEYPLSSTTDEGPPAYGTPTYGPPSYDEPPSYSEPPSYGAKFRGIEV